MQFSSKLAFIIWWLLILLGLANGSMFFVFIGIMAIVSNLPKKVSQKSWEKVIDARDLNGSNFLDSFVKLIGASIPSFNTQNSSIGQFFTSFPFPQMDFFKLVTRWILGIFVIMIVFSGFKVIQPGYKGVKVRLGSVYEQMLDAGLHWKVPFIDTIQQINVQVQKVQATSNSATKDLQTVEATVALNYSLKAWEVVNLYKTIGDEDMIADKVIQPAAYEAVKAVTAQYTAEELISKRANVSADMIKIITEKLDKIGIQVVAVNIVNFKFSEAFDNAIENKVKAEQEALTAKNKLESIKFEAQQKIEQSKAEAETIKIQANAIREQGGAEYIQLKWIEKWNGQLPTTNLGAGGNGLILNLNK
jgi:regulator of protease activity HflC (stomatin/prohibitin superfamily)